MRSRTMKKLQDTKDLDPYPHKFSVTTDMSTYMEQYEPLQTGEEKKDVEVSVAGRIYLTVRSLLVPGSQCLARLTK